MRNNALNDIPRNRVNLSYTLCFLQTEEQAKSNVEGEVQNTVVVIPEFAEHRFASWICKEAPNN